MQLAPLVRLSGSRWALPLALAVALAVALINETGYREAREAIAMTGGHERNRADLQVLLRSLVDAETGQRGYLLSGRVGYLQPYEVAVAEVEHTLARLHRAYEGDAQTRPQLVKLDDKVQQRLSELRTTIDMHAAGKHEQALELTLSDIGKEKMDELRALLTALRDHEIRQGDERRRELNNTLQWSRFGVHLMAALALLALWFSLRKARALDQANKLHAQALLRERDQLEAEVQRRTAELSELTQHLQSAREDERSRLARELHDELGALLTAAKLDVARLRRALGGSAPQAGDRLASLTQTLDHGIALKRQIIENLRPSALSNLGLAAALEILARQFGERSEIEVQTTLSSVALDEVGQITVYRFVQEALTNIGKYAKARRVQVSLAALPPPGGGVRVQVHDDGIGFDPRAVRRSAHGLSGMRYRVQAAGGAMQVDAAPGRGTRLQMELPASPPATDPADVQPAPHG
jgi:signal transduction histidine kinase